jgi:hypothetical protein
MMTEDGKKQEAAQRRRDEALKAAGITDREPEPSAAIGGDDLTPSSPPVEVAAPAPAGRWPRWMVEDALRFLTVWFLFLCAVALFVLSVRRLKVAT